MATSDEKRGGTMGEINRIDDCFDKSVTIPQDAGRAAVNEWVRARGGVFLEPLEVAADAPPCTHYDVDASRLEPWVDRALAGYFRRAMFGDEAALYLPESG